MTTPDPYSDTSWRRETVPRGSHIVHSVTGHYPEDLAEIDRLRQRVTVLEETIRRIRDLAAEIVKRGGA